MTPWQAWHEMAQESGKAARLVEAEGCLRSAASRYYYPAYQVTTALLLYRGRTPPEGREAWSHDETPALVALETGRFIPSRDRRRDLTSRLLGLYSLRLTADYRASAVVSPAQVNGDGRDARFWIKAAEDTLPQEQQ